jgi:predicted RecA/RadA family phage recombinase
MAAKFSQDGNAIDFTAPSGGVVKGSFYKIGSAIVWAGEKAPEGEQFPGWMEGAYTDVPAATSQSWAEGVTLYWDDTAKKFTTTATSNTKAGVATAAKGSSAAVGGIRLIPTI